VRPNLHTKIDGVVEPNSPQQLCRPSQVLQISTTVSRSSSIALGMNTHARRSYKNSNQTKRQRKWAPKRKKQTKKATTNNRILESLQEAEEETNRIVEKNKIRITGCGRRLILFSL
jgi:hypothetical protein